MPMGAEGIWMPRSESGKGSLRILIASMTAVSSLESVEPCRLFEVNRPIEDGFLLNTLDLGLSLMDAEEPEMSEGVRAYGGSTRGSREVFDDSIALDWDASDEIRDVLIDSEPDLCGPTCRSAALGRLPFCPTPPPALSVLRPGFFFVSFEGEWCSGTVVWDWTGAFLRVGRRVEAFLWGG
jgi:hypothetical protein